MAYCDNNYIAYTKESKTERKYVGQKSLLNFWFHSKSCRMQNNVNYQKAKIFGKSVVSAWMAASLSLFMAYYTGKHLISVLLKRLG